MTGDFTELAATLTQFGAAGLMGWLWLGERRHAAQRERELTEAHTRLTSDRSCLDATLAALRDNTRALSAIEAGQRSLGALLQALLRGRGVVLGVEERSA